MINDSRLALFILLGQTASKAAAVHPESAHPEPLMISDTFNLAASIPEAVREANSASLAYRLFFVFERYLREFVVEVLSKEAEGSWWDKVPEDIKTDVAKTEGTEQTKSWMALGSRDRSALMTYSQLLSTIDHCWKSHFEELLRDKALLQEARHIAHLRNTVCHMSNISDEELPRIQQVMRDWFRVVSP